MSTANVRSTDAIKSFRTNLINFAEEARNALSSTEMEIRQVRNWLERDQLSYWRAQVKKCTELVSLARTELHRRQIMASNSDAVSDTDQKEALREAQRKLREAEEMVERIKRWIPVLEHAVAEYHSQSQPLGDRLAGGFIATINMVDRTIATLDAYLAMAPAPTVAHEPKKAGTTAEAKGATGPAPEKSEGAAEPSPAKGATEPAAASGNGADGAEAEAAARQEVAS